MSNNPNIGQKASGQFKVQVVRNGQVIEDRPWRKNLILNSGLNIIRSYMWADAFHYASAGTDGSANYEDSGAGTAASDAAGNVTFTTYSLAVSRTGAIILWDSGEIGRITGGSGASCTITPAPGGAGIPDGPFTLFRAERTTLVAPRVGPTYGYTRTYLANYPHTFTSVNGNAITMRRTYDFPVEGSPVIYQEVGVHPVWANGATCFSRMTIPGGISLGVGDQLRLVYQLVVTFGPINAVQTGTMNVTGWPVLPALTTNVKWAIWKVGLSGVNADGSTGYAVPADWCHTNEPAVLQPLGLDGSWTMWLSSTRAGYGTWTFPGTSPNHPNYYDSNYAGWPQFVNYDSSGLVYSVEKQMKVGTTSANYDTWGYVRAFGQGFGMTTYPFYQSQATQVGWTVEFDEDQTKTNIQNLALGMKFSWSRELAFN